MTIMLSDLSQRASRHPWHSRLRLLAAFGILLAAATSALFQPIDHASAFGEGTDVKEIADQLQCPVCHGQSVSESDSQVAQAMRATIRDMLDDGRTEGEIKDFFIARYGRGVLREPPKSGIVSIVWWVPGIALIVGSGIVFSVARQRRRGEARQTAPVGAGASPSATAPTATPATEDTTAHTLGLTTDKLREYQDRLRRELEGRTR